MNETLTNSLRREQRETEVLEAALALFAEYGFKKASVEDIALRLGMTAAALYRYATDKRDLYRKAVARAFRLWQEAVARAIADEAEPVARFRTACRRAFLYLAEEPRLRRILAADPGLFPLFEADDPFSDINQSSVDLLESLIKEGVEAGVFSGRGEERAAARVIFSLYVLFIQKAYVAGEEGETALFEKGLDLVLDGLVVRH